MSRIAILMPLLLICLLAPARAQDRSLHISELSVYSLKDGPASVANRFSHEEADLLGLSMLFEISGLDDGRREKLELFLVAYSAEDDERKHPLIKQKRTESFGNGQYVLEFTDFMDADAWLGDSRFTAVLEASLKGARTVSMEQSFTIEGPPLPTVRFEEFSAYSWERGPGYEELEPGEEFVIDLTLAVDDNETGLDPRLRLLVIMEEEMWYLDPEDPGMPSGNNWSEAWLRGGGSEWRVYARARLPLFFDKAYDYYHDFRVYAFVGFGENPQRETDYIRMTLTDPDNGELRESQDLTERQAQVAAGSHWAIRQTKGPEAD
ncbi:hypothetical protein KDL44_04630 [bacterium]|nr:hypothetical protein [bacterium]